MNKILKYLFSIALAAGLFWYVYKDQSAGELLEIFKQASPFWIAVSVICSLISHYSRAVRWSIALQPLGYRTHHPRVFMAVMTGYLGNTVIPRAGEVVRCGVLQKTESVPVKVGFGSVIAERALDLIIYIILFSITMLLEFDTLSVFLGELMSDSAEGIRYRMLLLGSLGTAALLGIALMIGFRHRLRQLPLYHKAVAFISGIAEGLLSITKLQKKQQALYLLHTVIIWSMYFCMSYLLFFGAPATAELGIGCGLAATVIGGLGMIIPTPGGTGSYHLLVAATLMAYGLTETDAKAFTFLMHGTQTLSIIFFGSLSLLFSNIISQRNSKEPAKVETA